MVSEISVLSSNSAALLVDHLALVVGYVVVFQYLFAHIEIARLNLALCILDGARHPGMLNGFAFRQFELVHDRCHTVGSKNAQQRIFQRQVETAGAGVALASGAAAQLVVHAARLVTFGADDMQAAAGDHLFVDRFPLGAQLLDPLFFDCRIQTIVHAHQFDGFLHVAAQHDIRTAARHVGGDGYHLGTSRLRHNLRFARMLLGVQDLMRQFFFFQQPDKSSDVSMDVVPTNTGCPRS